MLFITWENESKPSNCNVSTDGVNHFPQAARDGMNSLVKNVVLDIIEKLLNPSL